MNGLIAGMDLLDGSSLGEAAYLLTALIMSVTVGVGLLAAIADWPRARAADPDSPAP